MVKQEDFKDDDTKYLMRALEEEGSLCNISAELKKMNITKTIIIGTNPIEAMFYAKMSAESGHDTGTKITNVLVMDSSYMHIYEREALEKSFSNLADRIYFLDISMPMEALGILMDGEKGELADVVVNLESIKGSETIANCMVKDNGMVCYTGMNSNYAQGLLIADCFGKEVIHYTLDGYVKGAYEFAVSLIRSIIPNLRVLDEYIKNIKIQKNLCL